MFSKRIFASLMFVAALSTPTFESLAAQTLYGSAGSQDQRENAVNADWTYNWGIEPKHSVEKANFEFVPMIWSANPTGVTAQIDRIFDLEQDHGVHVDYVLGFNEPELPTQANMSVTQAIDTWDVITNAFENTDIKLVSPAVSGGGAIRVDDPARPDGWLTEFMDEVEVRNTDANLTNDLQVDAIAYHFYSVAFNPQTEATKLIGQIDDLWDRYQRPIWLTEFAGTSFSLDNPVHSVAERTAFNKEFVEALIPEFESRDYVERVAWWQFGALGQPYSALSTSSDGVRTPTGIGEAYSRTTLEAGESYNLAAGETAATDVHYLKGGSLTNTGPALDTALRAVDAIEGDNSIGGTGDFGFEEAEDAFVRVRGGATLRKQGSNKVSLKGAWVDNDGSLRVEAGTLSLQEGTEVNGSGVLHVASGGTLELGMGSDLAASTIEQSVELAGGDVLLNQRATGGSHVVSGATVLQSTASFDGAGSLLISGQVSGSGGIDKAGSGTLFLKQGNTQTGVTNVASGKLVVANSSGSATGTGSVLIQSAATLEGNGAIDGDVFIAGAIAPGVSKSSYGTTSPPPFTPGVVVDAIDFDFTGVQDDAPLTQTSTLSSALRLVSGLDFGSGVRPRNAANEGNEFNVAGFRTDTNAGAGANSGDYLTFTIAPVEGLAVVVEDVTYELRRNGTGAAKQYTVMSSIDGFSWPERWGNLQLASGDTSTHVFTSSNPGAEAIADEIEFRIVGVDATSDSGNTHFYAASVDASFVSDPNSVAFDPTGILELGGNYTQLDFATLEIDLGGTAAGDYDQLQVAGDVSLAGILDVSLFDGFSGTVGQTFDIITGDSITGMFDSVITSDGLNVAVNYSGSAVSLELLASLPGDFDNDGDVDIDDVELLAANFGSSATTNPGMDLNNDNSIDLADHDLHITTLVQDSNGTGALLGDLNLDGDVDISQFDTSTFTNVGDASVLLSNLGQTSGQTYSDGDLNGDGDVDISQFDVATFTNVGDASRLLANLGQTTASAQPASAAVPEPGSLSFLAIAAVGMLARRKRSWLILIPVNLNPATPSFKFQNRGAPV